MPALDGWAARWVGQHDRIQAMRDRSTLRSSTRPRSSAGVRSSRVAAGNMPSSSSAMCIWPIGLVEPGDPRAAAAQAYALAGLIHVGEVDFCQDAAAAVAAAVAAGLRPGTSAARGAREALTTLASVSGALDA